MRASSTRRLARLYHRVLGGIDTFSRAVIGTPLHPYQLEPARAIIRSVLRRQGLTFTVMMSRQAGKNELSAQLEAYLLNLFQVRGGNIVKCAPTFNPQILHSRQRLEARLENPLNRGRWRTTLGRAVRLGKASVLFYSADESAHVVGATAHLLLEVDEAQDVDEEKYLREFRPMGATTNCTTVLYGTPWGGDNLLERARAEHLAQEAQDGIRRHFEYPWTDAAVHNPAYERYVRQEMARLGEDHPVIRTQYWLESLPALGRLLSETQLALLAGAHSRQVGPTPGRQYVAGVDVGGSTSVLDVAGWRPEGDEVTEPAAPTSTLTPSTSHDATVVTIGAVDWAPLADLVIEPRLEVVAHYCWTGLSQREQYERLLALLRDHWRCRRVVVDATGLGAGLADFLVAALGRRVVAPFVFTAASKSRLGYGLLAAINGGRLKLYRERDTLEARQCWAELRAARQTLAANRRLSFSVPPAEGHDDFLTSLALVVEAGRLEPVRRAVGRQQL